MNLLETLLALAILVIILAGLGGVIQQAHETENQKLAANDLLLITKASRKYGQDLQSKLLENASKTTGLTLTTDKGIPEELLPYVNIGHSGRNVWGQTYQITFRQNNLADDTSNLMVFVTTQGGYQGYGLESTPRFLWKNIRGAAKHLASLLDADLPDNAYFAAGYLTSQGFLEGQGFSLDLNTYQIPNISEGHLGTVSNLLDAKGQASLQSGDYLYRVAVDGRPELNSMSTSLDMSDHSIDHVGELGFTAQDEPTSPCDQEHLGSVYLQNGTDKTNGLYICKKVGDDYVYQEIIDTGSIVLKDFLMLPHGQDVAKPSCVQGEPEIWVSPVAIAKQNNRTPPITAFQAYAVEKNPSTWSINLRMQAIGDSTWHYPNASVAQAQVITLCRPKYAR